MNLTILRRVLVTGLTSICLGCDYISETTTGGGGDNDSASEEVTAVTAAAAEAPETAAAAEAPETAAAPERNSEPQVLLDPEQATLEGAAQYYCKGGECWWAVHCGHAICDGSWNWEFPSSGTYRLDWRGLENKCSGSPPFELKINDKTVVFRSCVPVLDKGTTIGFALRLAAKHHRVAESVIITLKEH